jgi:hypothetical protein
MNKMKGVSLSITLLLKRVATWEILKCQL